MPVCQARDPQSGLNHSVPVTVKVEDVNQPPTCNPSSLSVTVPWHVTASDSVIMVNCTDLDPSPGFSTLTYRVDRKLAAFFFLSVCVGVCVCVLSLIHI